MDEEAGTDSILFTLGKTEIAWSSGTVAVAVEKEKNMIKTCIMKA